MERTNRRNWTKVENGQTKLATGNGARYERQRRRGRANNMVVGRGVKGRVGERDVRLFCVRQVASRRSARPLSLPFAASVRCADCAVKKSVAQPGRDQHNRWWDCSCSCSCSCWCCPSPCCCCCCFGRKCVKKRAARLNEHKMHVEASRELRVPSEKRIEPKKVSLRCQTRNTSSAGVHQPDRLPTVESRVPVPVPVAAPMPVPEPVTDRVPLDLSRSLSPIKYCTRCLRRTCCLLEEKRGF